MVAEGPFTSRSTIADIVFPHFLVETISVMCSGMITNMNINNNIKINMDIEMDMDMKTVMDMNPRCKSGPLQKGILNFKYCL